jgi:hypothetical protein
MFVTSFRAKHLFLSQLFARKKGFFHSSSVGRVLLNTGTYKPGLPDFSLYNTPKLGKNIPKDHKMYQMTVNIPKGRKISQMATKYVNIFHCKVLQNLPKLRFLI